MIVLKRAALIFTFGVLSTNACPFGGGDPSDKILPDEVMTALARQTNPNHPEIHRERRLNEDGGGGPPALVPAGVPDYGGGALNVHFNNSFTSNGLSTVFYTDPTSSQSWTLPEVIELYRSGQIDPNGPGVGQDLCYFSFQSLPPPLYVANQTKVVPRVVDGEDQSFYNYPKSDLPRFMELADQAVNRLSTFVSEDSPFVKFATCAAGGEASKALCAEGVQGQEGSQCDAARSGSAVTWAQAIALFKIGNDTDAFGNFIKNVWRDSPDGHRANIVWAYAPNAYTEPGNENFGGIQGSVEPGWGNNGGLRAKVVACDHIDRKFFQAKNPDGNMVMGSDAIDASTNNTWADEALKEWTRLCGIPVFGGDNSDCIVSADVPTIVPEPPTPNAFLPVDEKCIESAEYKGDSSTCLKYIDPGLGDQTSYNKFTGMYDDAISKCGITFCSALTYTNSSGGIGVDENGFLYCNDSNYRGPTKCEEGNKYIEGLMAFVDCSLEAYTTVTKEKEAATKTSENAAAGVSTESCARMLECEEKAIASVTRDWDIRFCSNFFDVLQNPLVFPDGEFDWVPGCGFSGDGSPGSGTYNQCSMIVDESSNIFGDSPTTSPTLGDFPTEATLGDSPTEATLGDSTTTSPTPGPTSTANTLTTNILATGFAWAFAMLLFN
eukprot:scaffold13575_cov56-Attheya_sp.AAC.2